MQIMVYIRTNGLPELSWMYLFASMLFFFACFEAQGNERLSFSKEHPLSVSEKPSSKTLLRPRQCYNCFSGDCLGTRWIKSVH